MERQTKAINTLFGRVHSTCEIPFLVIMVKVYYQKLKNFNIYATLCLDFPCFTCKSQHSDGGICIIMLV